MEYQLTKEQEKRIKKIKYNDWLFFSTFEVEFYPKEKLK